jgi:hypothetical protein
LQANVARLLVILSFGRTLRRILIACSVWHLVPLALTLTNPLYY